MDTQALRTTLQNLVQAMPTMSAQVGEAIDTGHAAVSAGDELAQHAAALAEQADAHVAQAQHAVEEHVHFLEDARAQLAQTSSRLDARAQELGELDAPLATLDESVGHVEDGLGKLQGSLAAGAAGLDEASASAHQHVEALFGALHEGHQRLAAAAETATTALQNVQQTVQGSHAALVDDVDAMTQQVTDHESSVADRVTGFLNDSNQAMGSLSQDLTTTLPRLMQDPVSSALDEVQSRIHDQIQQLIRSAMDHVLGSLDDFEKKVSDAQQGSELSRQVLQPLFDEIEEVAKPLIGSLDSIRDAATMVGIAF